MKRKMDGLLRTHHCGKLRSEDVGNEVVLCGWVNKYRNLGGLHFVDLRDKYGVTQLGFEEFLGDIGRLKEISLESVIRVAGIVRMRPPTAINKKMVTGEIEIQVKEMDILSVADKDKIPFLPFGAIDSSEDLKLKYRYLDLRTNRLQNILTLRSRTMTKTRQVLVDEGFIEVETPILYKTTPEGARDYIVPSRVHPGEVYALPQSPQTLKQLLMIGGTDRYFQLCRCFRDEDLRADRQPEFSQIDIEVSFATSGYIKLLAERLLKSIYGLDENFVMPAMDYATALARYGSDKPDIRFELEHIIVTNIFKTSEFSVFAKLAMDGGMVKAMFVPASVGVFSRKDIDGFAEVIKPFGGQGVAWFKVADGLRSGGISKFITDDIYDDLCSISGESSDGTWLFVGHEQDDVVHGSADVLRRFLGKKLELIKDGYHFLWVYDFPLLEWSEKDGRFSAKHHPFTMPKVDELNKFMCGDHGQLKDCLAEAYDVVCNGYELGGGSVRIHNGDVQKRMFEVLGMSEEDAQKQFGFFIEALRYGTPPHAGMAFGLDRVVMLLANTDNIRDVIAFPKTNSAKDLMADSPSKPSAKQIEELSFHWNLKK